MFVWKVFTNKLYDYMQWPGLVQTVWRTESSEVNERLATVAVWQADSAIHMVESANQR